MAEKAQNVELACLEAVEVASYECGKDVSFRFSCTVYEKKRTCNDIPSIELGAVWTPFVFIGQAIQNH